MSLSLEQELEAVIESADYRVRLRGESFLHVNVHYVPSVRVVDIGGRIPVVLENGQIGCKLFCGPQRWRYWRARRFVRQTIRGHRTLVAEGVLLA